MQWEHTRPTSRSLAGAELGKAGILRAVESPADLLQVSVPWMCDFEGTSELAVQVTVGMAAWAWSRRRGGAQGVCIRGRTEDSAQAENCRLFHAVDGVSA